MNKGELVGAIAVKTGASKKVVDSVLSATLDTIIESVAEGEKVTFVGFGTFEARERKAREGRNPKTGEVMEIPAVTVPIFSAGKNFKDAVKDGD